MRIFNISQNTVNLNNLTNKTLNNSDKSFTNNFSSKLFSAPDTVSFGSRKKEDEETEEESIKRPRRRKKGEGRKIFKGAAGIAAALGLVSGGIQGYNATAAVLAQRELEQAFKNNPKNVALAFIDTFASGDKTFGADGMHFEYLEKANTNPFAIQNWDDSKIGPNSVVALDFADGVFSSASFDIDGDKHPEIIVTTDKDNKLVISYDYDSDGNIDTTEVPLQKEK